MNSTAALCFMQGIVAWSDVDIIDMMCLGLLMQVVDPHPVDDYFEMAM